MIRIERRKEQEGPMEWLLINAEAAFYAGIVLLAGAMRFCGLGSWPLLRSEASQAWAAWQLLQGGSAPGHEFLGYSPLLFAGNVLGFFAFGGGDAVARLWSALLGTAVVILPYFLRQELGRWGALATSLLLALSPTFLYFSRTLDGHIVVAASALALLVAVSGYARERKVCYVYLGVIALAFGLMSESSFYTLLLAVACFAGYLVARARRGTISESESALVAACKELLENKPLCLRAAGMLIALVTLVSSLLLFNIGGWQATLDVFARWLQRFTVVGGSRPWYYYLELLLTYEILPLLAGLAGFVLAVKRDEWFPRFLALWFLVALVTQSVGGERPAGASLIIFLPLVLLAGHAIERLAAAIGKAAIDPQNWVFLALVAVLVAFLYIQMVNFSVAGDRAYLRLAMATVGVLLFSFVAFWYWMGTRQALPVGAVALLGIALAWTLHTTTELNYYTARDPRELLNGPTTSMDILNVKPFLEDMGGRLARDRYAMTILIEERLVPVLAWYTKDFRSVRFTRTASATPAEMAVIVAAQPEAKGPAQYVGQTFRLQETAQTDGLGWGDWVKWFLKRYEIGSVVSEKIKVWVKPPGQ